MIDKLVLFDMVLSCHVLSCFVLFCHVLFCSVLTLLRMKRTHKLHTLKFMCNFYYIYFLVFKLLTVTAVWQYKIYHWLGKLKDLTFLFIFRLIKCTLHEVRGKVDVVVQSMLKPIWYHTSIVTAKRRVRGITATKTSLVNISGPPFGTH
jgi:hypothetical protein